MGQWVFVLPGAENQNDCMFFVNPSLAGYDVSDGVSICLTVVFKEAQYKVTLDEADRGGWYASGKYAMHPAGQAEDYTIRVDMTYADGTRESVDLSKAEVSASWPELHDGRVVLEKGSEDAGAQQKIQLDSYMKETSDSPLFEFRVENEKGCEVTLDSQNLSASVQSTKRKGEFTLAAVDPAGNQEVAEMSVIAAAGTGKGFGIGMIVLAAIAIAVIAALLLKRNREKSGHSGKETRMIEAREAVEKCCKKVEKLTRTLENTLHEIRTTGQVAEERVRQDGEASAYNLEDIRTMVEDAETLVLEPCCENISLMRTILGGVSQKLLKMQGNARIGKDNGSHQETENPKNYLDAGKRQEILSKIEVDIAGAETLCEEMTTILKTLKEIAYREEIPFGRDISMTVTDGHSEYETRRACREAYGAAAPGVFALDTLKFLSKSEAWVTLPEIIGQKTDIRIFAIDGERMRAIAEKPVIIWQGKNQRIAEFSYDQDVVLHLRDHADAEIRLHFEK